MCVGVQGEVEYVRRVAIDANLLLWCLFDYYVTLGDPLNHTLLK